MKKRKICILCLLLAGLLTLSGCAMLGVPQASDSSDSNASDTESPFTNRDSEITTESSTEQIVIGGEPPRYLWESFLDVENLLNYVSVVGADSEMCQYAKPEDYQSAHGWSNTMVDRIKEVGEVYVPCLADETNPSFILTVLIRYNHFRLIPNCGGYITFIVIRGIAEVMVQCQLLVQL